MSGIFLFLLCIAAAGEDPGKNPSLVPISSYTTSIADQDDNVKRNIFLASEKINGVTLQPSDIFSFNDIVGEGSAANGYMNGRVMYRDTIHMEPGGGLCQVSSTLFNAFLLAGLSIVERHRHFQPVTYVPLGLDATIKYGKKNLKIKNTTGQYIRILVLLNDKSLTIQVLAKKALPFRFDIETEEEELPLPLEEDQGRIRQAISVYVYRKKYSGNKLLETQLLYKDYYPPVKFK